MDIYKQLCAELLDELKYQTDWSIAEELKERASAALAEPELEGPTDEEIMELMPQQMRDNLAAAARALSSFNPDNIKAASVFRIILNRHSVDHARAVLARWGNHPGSPDSSTPQPVPVSERLPGPSDCAPWPKDSDASAWCWVGTDKDGGWEWEQRSAGCLVMFPGDFTHWLPAHALPVPSSGKEEA